MDVRLRAVLLLEAAATKQGGMLSYVRTFIHTSPFSPHACMRYPGVHDMVAALNAEHGWDVPIHVDAVSMCVLHQDSGSCVDPSCIQIDSWDCLVREHGLSVLPMKRNLVILPRSMHHCDKYCPTFPSK